MVTPDARKSSEFQLMDVDATPQTSQPVYPNPKSVSVVECELCEISITVQADANRRFSRPIKIECACNTMYSILVDNRKHNRKAMHFNGIYIQSVSKDQKGEIRIEDISFSGIKFSTQATHKLQVDDILLIQFTLDDACHTPIVARVMVQHVNGQAIGAQFVNTHDFSPALAAYLMV